jgi:hypothetical protein
MLQPPELLDAVAEALRKEVGPAVVDPFAKTQAFMAAVILQKLAGQLRTPVVDDAEARGAVVTDVRASIGDGAPATVLVALDDLAVDGDPATWRALVTTLYAARAELGADRFDDALAVVRGGLRTRLDRMLTYAT